MYGERCLVEIEGMNEFKWIMIYDDEQKARL